MPPWSSLLGRLSGRAGGSIVSNTVGYAAGGAAQSALMPEIQPIANAAWSASPTIPLSPADAAQMVVQNILSESDAATEASNSGINAERLHRLVRLAGDPPGPETLLAMQDRGIIDPARLEEGLRQSRLKPEWIAEYTKMARNLLSAQALAEMVVQGITEETAATREAAYVGTEAADFARMVRLAGAPPGNMETLAMWNRNILKEDEVNLALRQSRLKPEWVDKVKLLRRDIISASMAAELVLKQRIPFEQGLRIAEANGVTAEDFRLMADVNGRPIGIIQALQLARRGKFKRAQFDEVVARSDVRTEYTDALWELRRVLPRLGTIERLIRAGELTTAQGTAYLLDLGYDPVIAAGMVNAAKQSKTQRTHDLTAAQIDLLYESGLEPEAWAIEHLKALGYDDEEAHWHLRMLDARLLVNAHSASIRRVHALYVSHKITDAAMQADLDSLGIETRVKELLIHAWTQERAENVTDLTNAEIGQALRYGIITRDDAIQRWLAHGYSVDNANIKADIIQRIRRVGAA